MIGGVARYWQDRRGTALAEFALVIPVLSVLTIGAIHLCILIYMASRLHFAVDDAARCGAIGTCTPATRAASNFGFAAFSPSFPAPTPNANCHGTLMTGAVTYRLNAVITSITVPLSAKSCFATQD